MSDESSLSQNKKSNSFLEIFWIFFKLGLTSFSGPIARLAYFREEFVRQRKWLSDHAYADLVALCQFLPGPASSQVGIAIGLSRGGFAGTFYHPFWTSGILSPLDFTLAAFIEVLESTVLDCAAAVRAIGGFRLALGGG